MYEAGICLLFYLLFYFVAVYCTCMRLAFAYYSTCCFILLLYWTIHVCGWYLLTILLVILFVCSALYMMYVAGICLLFYLLFYFVAVYCTCMRLAFAYYSTCYFILLQCTVHVRGWHLPTILHVILLSCSVLYMYVAGICLLFYLLFYLVAVYYTCTYVHAFTYYSTCYFI